MTDAELRAIEERANAVTPEPWKLALTSQTILAPDGSALAHLFHGSPDHPEVQEQARRDAAFLLGCRADVPALIARVRELEAALRAAELRGVRAGLEAAAQACSKEWTACGESCHRHDLDAIRALDPASVPIPDDNKK